MGRDLRLPRYVHAFVDRHGKPRFYLRRPGFKRIPLPGLPYSAEFMEGYSAGMSDTASTPKLEIGASRTKPGTINALIIAYYQSSEFRTLANETQRTRRNILERFRTDHGDKRVALLGPEHVRRMLATKIDKPAVARNWLNTVAALMRFAVAEGIRGDDPTRDVKRPRPQGEGFTTWSEEDITKFEAAHPIGTRARLALALLLYTAQRRSDVVRLGPQHIRDGLFHVRQQKTGAALQLPVHPELCAVIEATPTGHLSFLVTEFGKPFSPAGFTNWFRDVCRDARLSTGLSAHGLRKAACRRLAELGCSANQIAAFSGHTSLREVQRYTVAADQARMAKAAMEKMTKAFPFKPGTTVGKPR